MKSGVSITSRSRRGDIRGPRRWALAGLALSSASCVPVSIAETSLALPAGPEARAPDAALAEPADLPTATPVATASAIGESQAFRGRTALDELRSLDCLAQAIYYEAASESEGGQRAVAQVVLNRVRHPAWPNSICGVVYQGPMRAGGGCQFTFTCDGSLVARPSGIAWGRARMLAAEALGGRSYEPVGLSTHYHTHAVSPAWAPALHKTTVIGAHNFYRLPGPRGEVGAFTAAYSGGEPLPRPTMSLVRPPASAGTETAAPMRAVAEPQTAALPRSETPQLVHWPPTPAPESTVREEYRHSGQWRTDAPASITGR